MAVGQDPRFEGLAEDELAEVRFAQDLDQQGLLQAGREQARVRALAKLARPAAPAEVPKKKGGAKGGRPRKQKPVEPPAGSSNGAGAPVPEGAATS